MTPRKMTEEEFAMAANIAINAANEVLEKAGITHLIVGQLGFYDTEDVKSGKTELRVSRVYGCPCWDCTNTIGGKCTCGGPNCYIP